MSRTRRAVAEAGVSGFGQMGSPDPQDWLPWLLRFEQMPGRFALVLHEPPAVFENVRGVLALAAGRGVAHWEPEPGQAAAAQRAARFFVRTAMLRPDADHYTLLGLARDFEPGTLREHYRLMMGLTHPDKLNPAEGWPADAAARINRAKNVLSDEHKRLAYDSALWPHSPVGARATAGPAPRSVTPRPAKAVRAPAPFPLKPAAKPPSLAADEGWSHRRKLVTASLGAAVVVALFVWTNELVHDRGSLQVRAPATPEAPLRLHPSARLPSLPAVASPVPVSLNPAAQALPPELDDVRPMLSALLDAVRAADAARAWAEVHPSWQSPGEAQAFTAAFESLLDGQRLARVSQARFTAQSEADQLVVQANMDLQLQDSAGALQQRPWHLTAYFVQQDGRAVMTRLVAGPPP